MLRLVLRTATTILLTGALLLAGGHAATAAPKTAQQQAATGRTPQQSVQIARAVDPDGLATRTAALQRTAMSVLPADQIEPLAAVLTEAQIDRFAHLTEGKRFELRVVTTTDGQLDLSATLVNADTPQRIPRGWQDNIPHCWEGWVAAYLYLAGTGAITGATTVAGVIPGIISGGFFWILGLGIDWGDAC